MRVLMLSWEYPPVVVGGLGRHVHDLARHLASAGHEVVVLCRHESGSDASDHPTTDSVLEGVRVIRVAEDPPHLVFERDLLAWTLAMGHAMIRAAHRLLGAWRPEVVHAHDWLVVHPAVALPNSWTCRWSRPCTRPRPVGTAAGCPSRSTSRCTRPSGGWPTGRTR